MAAATKSCREREGRRAARFLKGLDGGLRVDGGCNGRGEVEGSLLKTLLRCLCKGGKGRNLRSVGMGDGMLAANQSWGVWLAG